MKLLILAVACFLTCNVAEARWFVRSKSVDVQVQKNVQVQKCGAGGCSTRFVLRRFR